MPAERSADSSLGRIPSNGDQQRMEAGFELPRSWEGAYQRASFRRLVNV